jgi:hypothetical protein
MEQEDGMHKVQLFGRDLIGKFMHCEPLPSFATRQLAIDAAESATGNNVNGAIAEGLNASLARLE